MELSLEHPWVWFSSLQTVTQIIVGICAFFLLANLFALFIAIDETPSDPEKELDPLYRFAIGVLLELSLIIYFWPEIYHFFRWWLPNTNFFLQLGSLALVCVCLVLFGHNIECGLLRGGIGKPTYPCMWGGLQRERGFMWATAAWLGILSMLYAIIYVIVWMVSGLLELGQKLL
jgi:uncharacterized membrane protein YuzA (DUF378 family)